MDSGKLTFSVPDDFTTLSDDEIALKYPHRNGPIEAVGNSNRGVSISYTVTKNAVLPEQLPAFKSKVEASFPQLVPGLHWITKDIQDINGTPWIYFEFTSAAADGGTIHNIELFTSCNNILVILNFNSEAKLFAQYEPKLRESVQSIKIHTPTGM